MTFKLGNPWTGFPMRSLCMDCLSTPHRYVGTKIMRNWKTTIFLHSRTQC